MKICKTVIVTVLVYWRDTWSFTAREENGLKMYENRVRRRIFGPETEAGEDCIVRSFTTCTLLTNQPTNQLYEAESLRS
jgi:hypothetical protein